MNVKQLRTLAQVADFLEGCRALEPVPASQAERYRWIEQTLRHFRYPRLSKAGKGLVIAYLGRITGYSRQQLTRLIRRYRDEGHIRWQVHPAHGFSSRYTAADVALLAETDALHDTPSGPAVKKLCERACAAVYGPRIPSNNVAARSTNSFRHCPTTTGCTPYSCRSR